MKIKHIINLLAAVVLSVEVGCAQSAPAGAEAQFKQLKESWELKEDGSQVYNLHKELTIYTHTAMNNTYGETFIKYNPLYQELKINESYTLQTDGTRIVTPDNAFVEVLPADAAGLPAYNHLKEMVVVHTGLELGATIVLDYSIISKPGYLPEIDVCQPLLQTSPVKNYEISFTYPAGKTPHYALLASAAEPTKASGNGSETMTWKFNDTQAMPRVPETSMQNGDIPGIAFTTYASNAEALKTVYAQFDSSAVFADLTAELLKDKKSRFDRFNTIYSYVLNEIENAPLSFQDAGYHIRPAEEVIASAYATEMEKVNILTGMLKAAGMEAEPAAAYNLDIDQNAFGLAGASKWLVVATLGRAHVFNLDVTSKLPAASTAEFIVNLKDGAKTEVRDITKMVTYRADIKLEGEKATADIYARFSNTYLPNYEITASDLLHLDNVSDWHHDCTFAEFNGTSAVEIEKAGDFTMVQLPATKVDLNTRRYASYNSERNTNLLLPDMFDEQFDYTIQIPEGMVYNTPDQVKEISNSVGNLTISFTQKDGQILVKRAISINKKLIAPAEYALFRALMIEWNDPHLRQVVLKKSAK